MKGTVTLFPLYSQKTGIICLQHTRTLTQTLCFDRHNIYSQIPDTKSVYPPRNIIIPVTINPLGYKKVPFDSVEKCQQEGNPYPRTHNVSSLCYFVIFQFYHVARLMATESSKHNNFRFTVHGTHS